MGSIPLDLTAARSAAGAAGPAGDGRHAGPAPRRGRQREAGEGGPFPEAPGPVFGLGWGKPRGKMFETIMVVVGAHFAFLLVVV